VIDTTRDMRAQTGIAGSYSAKHVVIDLQVASARTRDRSPEEIRDTLIDAADVIRTLTIVLDGKD